jgi:hypothetical protein
MGVRRLVDRFMISLPLTTRLSFDFRRSFVIISAYVSIGCTSQRCFQIRTISTSFEIDGLADMDIDDAKKALVLLLELLLVEYLYGEDAVGSGFPVCCS